MRSPASLLRLAGCTLHSVYEQLQFACSLSHAPDSLTAQHQLANALWLHWVCTQLKSRKMYSSLCWYANVVSKQKERKGTCLLSCFFLSSILAQVHMRFLCGVVNVRTQREVDQATICSKEYFTTYVDSPAVVYTIMAHQPRMPWTLRQYCELVPSTWVLHRWSPILLHSIFSLPNISVSSLAFDLCFFYDVKWIRPCEGNNFVCINRLSNMTFWCLYLEFEMCWKIHDHDKRFDPWT